MRFRHLPTFSLIEDQFVGIPLRIERKGVHPRKGNNHKAPPPAWEIKAREEGLRGKRSKQLMVTQWPILCHRPTPHLHPLKTVNYIFLIRYLINSC